MSSVRIFDPTRKTYCHSRQTHGKEAIHRKEKSRTSRPDIARSRGSSANFVRARCMGITPPRRPRKRMPAANLGALAIAGARFSEFLEESKAATTSMVERTMVEIDNHIEAPVFPGPLPPGEGGSLAG